MFTQGKISEQSKNRKKIMPKKISGKYVEYWECYESLECLMTGVAGVIRYLGTGVARKVQVI